MDAKSLKREAMIYSRNKRFFDELKMHERNGDITRQQLLTLRGQALAGNEQEAQKGLGRILRNGED